MNVCVIKLALLMLVCMIYVYVKVGAAVCLSGKYDDNYCPSPHHSPYPCYYNVIRGRRFIPTSRCHLTAMSTP